MAPVPIGFVMSLSVRVSIEHGDQVMTLGVLPGSVTDYRADGTKRYLHFFDLGIGGALLESTTPPSFETSLLRLADLTAMSPVALLQPGESHREPFRDPFGHEFVLIITVTEETP